jgi:hypothetical protein
VPNVKEKLEESICWTSAIIFKLLMTKMN